MSETPLLFQWQGDGFTPANAYAARRADQVYVVGEVYKLAEHNDRSSESHRHYFASIAEAWKNLPEHLSERFPSPEHLRKFALIKSGYRDGHTMAFDTEADAERVAAFMEPIDEFAVIIVNDATVTRYTAKSQSYRAMGKKEFGESKQAVLDALDDLLNVERGSISKNAGKAA